MFQENEEYDVMTLTFEDGNEQNCLVLAIFEVDGQDYTALMPEDTINDEESTVYLYRYSEDENGEPILGDIEDDEEYEAVTDAFDEILDEEEFNAESEN